MLCGPTQTSLALTVLTASYCKHLRLSVCRHSLAVKIFSVCGQGSRPSANNLMPPSAVYNQLMDGVDEWNHTLGGITWRHFPVGLNVSNSLMHLHGLPSSSVSHCHSPTGASWADLPSKLLALISRPASVGNQHKIMLAMARHVHFYKYILANHLS